jgi:MFS family permease
MSRFQIGLVEGAAVLLVAIMSAVAGFHSDRSPSTARLMWIRIGYGLPMIARVIIALATNGWVWPTLALYGLSMACTEGVGKAMVADLVPKGSRGKALGIFYALTGLTQLVASAMMGLVWDRIDPSASFFLAAGIAFIAIVALPAVRTSR